MRNPKMNIPDGSRLYQVYMVLGFACVLLLLFVMDIYHTLEPVDDKAASNEERAFSRENKTPAAARKLLDLSRSADDGDGSDVNRIGTACTKDNILIFQGPTDPLPNGIPTYTVQVQNVCASGSCSISNIHFSCGWFSSARLINPRIFRRIGYNDCLVNNGEPLNPGQCLIFQYANSFPYPMSVSSVECY